MAPDTQQDDAILKVTSYLSASLSEERHSINEQLLQSHDRLLSRLDAHLRDNAFSGLLSNSHSQGSGAVHTPNFGATPIGTSDISIELPKTFPDGPSPVGDSLPRAMNHDANGLDASAQRKDVGSDSTAPMEKQGAKKVHEEKERTHVVHEEKKLEKDTWLPSSPTKNMPMVMGKKRPVSPACAHAVNEFRKSGSCIGQKDPHAYVHDSDGSLICRLISHPMFEGFFIGVILVNTLQIAMMAQYKGFDHGHHLKYPQMTTNAANTWPGVHTILMGMEYTFAGLYTIELGLKLLGLRLKFFRSTWNLFDLFLVIMWYISELDEGLIGNPMILRLARIAKLMRVVRHIGWLQAFDSLHMLIAAMVSSVAVLMWSSLILTVLMTIAALVTNGLLAGYLEDAQEDMERRREVYIYFGTFSRSLVSMFEMAFASHVPITRTVMENVHEAYILYFLFFKCVVSLSVMKVISGVFLHETFKVCNEDDELMIIQKKRAIKVFTAKMQKLFAEADTSGNDRLSWEEFEKELDHETIRTWISAMELDTSNIMRLWALLDNGGDGQLTATELVSGVARLKGPAKSIDLHYFFDQAWLKHDVDEMMKMLHEIKSEREFFTPSPANKQFFHSESPTSPIHLCPSLFQSPQSEYQLGEIEGPINFTYDSSIARVDIASRENSRLSSGIVSRENSRMASREDSRGLTSLAEQNQDRNQVTV